MRPSGESALTDSAPQNPLLDARGLPRFDSIEPRHVEPGIRSLLDELGDEITRLEAEVEPTWPGLVSLRTCRSSRSD